MITSEGGHKEHKPFQAKATVKILGKVFKKVLSWAMDLYMHRVKSIYRVRSHDII